MNKNIPAICKNIHDSECFRHYYVFKVEYNVKPGYTGEEDDDLIEHNDLENQEAEFKVTRKIMRPNDLQDQKAEFQ